MAASEGYGELNALLGEGSEFEGKLAFEGRVRIDGTFSGEIFSEGVLVIGRSARLQAQVEVGTAVVQGEIEGNIVAKDAIELKASAKVVGDIHTPSLIVEKGAVLQGGCRMLPERS